MRTGFLFLDLGLKDNSKLAAILIAIVFVLFGCAREAVEKPPVEMPTHEVRDDLGRSVRVPPTIDRAISLAPSLTEMIFAIGAGDKLVGVTTYCNFPAEAAAIEKVGDTQTPNIERIIALKPQVVFVSTASQLEAFTRTLNEQGISVYVTNPASLDDVFRDLKQLGDLFGTNTQAESVVASLGARVDRVKQGAGGSQRPRVFVQISNEPLFTIGRDSFLTRLVELAGGESVPKDVATAYPKLSKETAAALDPDVIILSDSEDNRNPSSVFRDSKAVKKSRVYRINADILSRPGPRLVDALEEISAKLKEEK